MSRFRIKSAVIWSMTALFYLYEVILRVSPSGITEELIHHHGLTCTSLGMLVAAYYWIYFIVQIPCGIIVDKIGARKVITTSSVICAFGTLLFASSHSVEIAFIGRTLVGLGSACAFISSLKVATEWFSPKRFALLAALTNMMGTLGGNFGGRPLAVLMHTYGWQEILMCMGYLGFIIAILCYILMQDKKSDQIQNVLEFWVELKGLLQNTQIWLAGIVGGILYLPITAVAELWGVPFIQKTFHIDNAKATWVTNLIFIGVAVGSPIFAIISDRLKSYKKTLQITSIFAGILSIMIVFASSFTLINIFIILFLLGCVIGGQVQAFSLAKINVEGNSYGTAMGLTNGIISFIGLCGQVLMGITIDFFWDGHISEIGTRIYGEHAYQFAMLSIPCLMLLCLGLLKFSKEKHINA